MKKSSEVLGLTMIGIKEGTENGIAQDFMIDAATKLVKYLILKSSSGYGFKIMKVTDIQGIGADYIMAPSVNAAVNIYESKAIMEEVEKGFFILGATVLSSSGDIIGNVIDFSFDKNTGQIGEIILDNGDIFSADKIATLAGKMVFLDTDGTFRQKLENITIIEKDQNLTPEIASGEIIDIESSEKSLEDEAINITSETEMQGIGTLVEEANESPAMQSEEIPLVETDPDIVIPAPEQIVVPEPEIIMPEPEPVVVSEPEIVTPEAEQIVVPEPEIIMPEPEAIVVPEPIIVNEKKSALEQESMAYLLGKVVKSDVVSDDGIFKVEAGTVLTQEIINMADIHDAILNLTLSV